MHLIEILLPVCDNEGRPFGAYKSTRVRQQLTECFGGVTAFTRAPAAGAYENNGKIQHDDIMVLEVMTPTLDRKWWASYRQKLEEDFAQDEIVIRASTIHRL